MTAQSSRITGEDTARRGAGDGLRADARLNRQRILVAARAVFAERGIDAPMTAVATRAGVGVATLYRRFPTRDDLLRAAFAEQTQTCSRVLAEAAADPDPWRGFCRLVETVCALQSDERAFPAAFLAAFPDAAHAHADAREGAERDALTLVRRAQAAGALRPDFHPADLGIVFLANGGLVAALPGDRSASRRLVAYLLEAFRARPTRGPLPSPLPLRLGHLPLITGGVRGGVRGVAEAECDHSDRSSGTLTAPDGRNER